MSTSTTIKVPRELRDRLAERARAGRTTLAGAIEAALDASDEQRFWSTVAAEHAALTAGGRADYVQTAVRDDLEDEADDAVSERDAW